MVALRVPLPPAFVAGPTPAAQSGRGRQAAQPRAPVSTCTSAKAPTLRRPQRPDPHRSLRTTLQPLTRRRPQHRRLYGGLARERLAVPPSSPLSPSPRPQTECAASSGGREPWTWRDGASPGARPGALRSAARQAGRPRRRQAPDRSQAFPGRRAPARVTPGRSGGPGGSTYEAGLGAPHLRGRGRGPRCARAPPAWRAVAPATLLGRAGWLGALARGGVTS